MAKSKSKKDEMQVRRITNKKERKSGNLFTRLRTDEWIKGYALFSPDPEADGNPFWFEYLEHYDKPNNQYVPCLGDDCYMCELGDNPSPRALTVFYFPDNDTKDRFKVFKMNGYLIRDFTEIDEEEGGVLGRKFRIKRLSDKGEYRATPQSDKPLTKKEVAALIKEAAAQIDFEKMVLNQAKAALSKVNSADALTDVEDDDDDDDDDTPVKTKGGSKKSDSKKNSKSKDEDEDEEDEDDEDEDEEEDEDEDDSDDDDSDDEDEDDDEDDDEDSDDDEDEDDEDEDEEESEDEEEEDSDDDDEEEAMKGQKVTVTSTSEKDETISGKLDNKGKAVKLYVGQNLDVDWDKVKKGAEITVDGVKDDEGDWVLTKVAVKKKK